MMGNTILLNVPWGGDLFDVMVLLAKYDYMAKFLQGTEVDWVVSGVFNPWGIDVVSYFRSLAYTRPYLLLMNSDFSSMSSANVISYFQYCLFFGFFPSFFSPDGNAFLLINMLICSIANSGNYWENPALYNRDRAVFEQYMPLLKKLDQAGWSPVTLATTDNAAVLIERFGYGSSVYFTLRNTATTSLRVTVTVDFASLYGTARPWTVAANVITTSVASVSDPTAGAATIALDINAGSTEMLTVTTAAAASVPETMRVMTMDMPFVTEPVRKMEWPLIVSCMLLLIVCVAAVGFALLFPRKPKRRQSRSTVSSPTERQTQSMPSTPRRLDKHRPMHVRISPQNSPQSSPVSPRRNYTGGTVTPRRTVSTRSLLGTESGTRPSVYNPFGDE